MNKFMILIRPFSKNIILNLLIFINIYGKLYLEKLLDKIYRIEYRITQKKIEENKTLIIFKCPSMFLPCLTRTHGKWVKRGYQGRMY